MEVKELRFETSKGKFFIVENIPSVLRQVPHDFCDRIGLLYGLTEEQARDIVDSSIYDEYYPNHTRISLTKSALDSIRSLIQSKGWYLFDNPYKHPQTMEIIPASLNWWYEQEQKHIEAESRTFHNPVIFKIK